MEKKRAIEGGGSLLNARLFNQSSSFMAGRPIAREEFAIELLGFAFI
jgi:hypothetical protein